MCPHNQRVNEMKGVILAMEERKNVSVETTADEYSKTAVPSTARKSFLSVLIISLGYVFVRGGLYSNILFFFHCEGNPFRFVQLSFSAERRGPGFPLINAYRLSGCIIGAMLTKCKHETFPLGYTLP